MTFSITPTPGAIHGRTTLNLSRMVTEHGRRVTMSLDPVEQVINAVCEAFRLSKHELLERTKRQHIAWPRQIAMALAYERGEFGLHYVGTRFAMDHGTVLCAVRRVKDRCETDKRSREQVERVKGMLA